MLTILGRDQRTCGGLSRRQLLQAGGAGLLGMNLSHVWAAEAAGAVSQPRARSVIFMFLFGGPSQLETFDLKPNAPSQIRGPFRPIASRSPGLLICEHLHRLARVSDKFCVLRSLTHSYNDHSGAGHYMQTGKRWHLPIGGGFHPTPRDWPAMGSVVEYLAQRNLAQRSRQEQQRDLPSYVVLPNTLGRLEQEGQYRRPGEHAGWLGRAYNPLTTRIDKRNNQDNPYWRECSDDELNFQIDGMAETQGVQLDPRHGRLSLLQQLDAQRRTFDGQRGVADFDRVRQRALALVTSERTRQALDIRREPDRVRDRYGRHLFGQATLMARRMVEANVRFVTVHYETCDGYSWDSHVHSRDVERYLLPTFDQALSALLTDLDERGLLNETLVVALGEMGRTPQANAQWGRGHWSTLFPVVLAGAGIRGGTLYGGSDKDAAFPIDRPTSPEDLAATIYHALGIDPEIRLPDVDGRPVPLIEGGRPVRGVFG